MLKRIRQITHELQGANMQPTCVILGREEMQSLAEELSRMYATTIDLSVTGDIKVGNLLVVSSNLPSFFSIGTKLEKVF